MTDKLREALEELEAACNGVAAGRSAKAYLQMIDDGQLEALDRLHNARNRARAALAAAPQPAPEQEMRKATEDAVVSVPKSLLLEVLEEAVMDSHATEHEFGGDAEPHRDRIASLQRLAAAPQPAPDRESLMEMIAQAQVTWNPDATSSTQHIADALLARGLRLPGGEETIAWAVLGSDGRPMPDAIYSERKGAHRLKPHPQARIVRVAIRVVEGGDDAA